MVSHSFLFTWTTIIIACNVHRIYTFGQKHYEVFKEAKEKTPDYTGAQVLKIRRCPEFISIANKNEFDVWSGNATHVDIMVLKKNVKKFKSELSTYLIPYEVMIKDVESLIKMHLHAVKLKNTISGKEVSDHRMTWSNYHRLHIIHEYMDYLAEKYPNRVTVGTMGLSKEGRFLKYCKVASSGNETGKAVFIDGGIHAREWISPAAVAYILKTLVEDRDQMPDTLLDLEYYVLPVVNPDGYEYSFTADRLWRKNRSGSGVCLGTDLNRNFNYNWAGKGSSYNPCSEIYRGKSATSEAESRAVSEFILGLKGKIEAYITFHSYGQLILIPFGFDYDELPHDYEELKRVGESAKEQIFRVGGALYEVGNTAYALYPASGGSDDWAKGAAGVKYSYTIELRDQGQYSFMLPPQEIIPASNDALEAFKAIASAVSNI